jgi:hypothetical protein
MKWAWAGFLVSGGPAFGQTLGTDCSTVLIAVQRQAARTAAAEGEWSGINALRSRGIGAWRVEFDPSELGEPPIGNGPRNSADGGRRLAGGSRGQIGGRGGQDDPRQRENLFLFHWA